MKYQTLEDIAGAYISATQNETAALFEQGEVIVAAVEQGWRTKDVVRHCASLTRRTARTVFSRYHVAKVFPPHLRDDGLDWSLHQLCADTPKPYDWLALAADGYTDKDGAHHDHSYRTLKAAIKAAGDEPDKDKPVYLLDNVGCRLEEIGVNMVMLALNSEFTDTLRQYQGAGVNVSLVLVQAPSVDLRKTA